VAEWFTHILVLIRVRDEGGVAAVTVDVVVAVARVFFVTAEGLVLFALRAGPAELEEDTCQLMSTRTC
jgi:hypothetical protein